jgi:hypothetical protein
MSNARNDVKNLLTLKLDSAQCQKDLNALAQEQLLVGSTGSAGQPVTAAAIEAVADQAQNYIYNGSTSNTVWDVSKFGPLPNGQAPFAGETVRDVFNRFPILAYSQFTGYAIFVNAASWATFGTNYGTATMLHEIIHKFGLNDGQMGAALGVDVNTPLGSTVLSSKLQTDCVNQ